MSFSHNPQRKNGTWWALHLTIEQQPLPFLNLILLVVWNFIKSNNPTMEVRENIEIDTLTVIDPLAIESIQRTLNNPKAYFTNSAVREG